ncbi:MAG: hypothetical protein II931_04665, partial [Clostridia bacterium]|nr:hypothetical protein [Clostridia bacterium]
LSDFCPSGYDFAIPSSRLNLTIQTLGVAFEFVGNYASVDFYHRALVCPSYQKSDCTENPYSHLIKEEIIIMK